MEHIFTTNYDGPPLVWTVFEHGTVISRLCGQCARQGLGHEREVAGDALDHAEG